MAAESNYTLNGIFHIGKTANDTGTVMIYLRGSMDAGAVSFGYFAGPNEDVFVPLAVPAPIAFGAIAAGAVAKMELGANIRFGIQITGSTVMNLNVLASDSY